MKIRKTTAGNYVGWYKGYYLVFHRRPHGGWSCLIRKNWKIFSLNGYHGTSLITMTKAKQWAKVTIDEGYSWVDSGI